MDFFPSIQLPAFSLFSFQPPLLLNFYLKYKLKESTECISEDCNPGSGSRHQQHKEEFFPLWPHAAFPPKGFTAIWIPFQIMPPPFPKIHNLATLFSVNEIILLSCSQIVFGSSFCLYRTAAGSWDPITGPGCLSPAGFCRIIDHCVLH